MANLLNENGLSYLKWCYAAGINPLHLTQSQRREAIQDWEENVDPSEVRITPIPVSNVKMI